MFPVCRYDQGLLSSIQTMDELAPDTYENRALACLTCLEGQSIGEGKANIISVMKDPQQPTKLEYREESGAIHSDNKHLLYL